MDNGSWVLLMLAALVTAGYLGYLYGRRNSEKQAEIDRLEEELQEARQRADSIKAGVDSHFEQSAVLFGTLAKDYRAFLDHFSESASNLGISQGRTEELLDQVARPLLARSTSAEPAPGSESEPDKGPEPPAPATGDGASPAGDAVTEAGSPVAAVEPGAHKSPGTNGDSSEPPAAAGSDEGSDAASDVKAQDTPPAAGTRGNGTGQAPGSPAGSRVD